MYQWLWLLGKVLLLVRVAASINFVHHRYEELVQVLFDVRGSCPYVTRLYSIGRSVQGRNLYVLEFSDSPGIHEPSKCAQKYNSCIAEEMLLSALPDQCTIGFSVVLESLCLMESSQGHGIPSRKFGQVKGKGEGCAEQNQCLD